MRRLSTLDTLFVTLDTRRFPMHGMGVLILDPTMAPQPLDLARLKSHLRACLPGMPPLRRRLLRIPFDLENPLWIEDPNFDLNAHMHHITVPAPGGREQLSALIDRVGNRPLDWSRPLWEVWFLEGLAEGRAALLWKMHHACIDGMGGIAMLGQLFDEVPDPPSRSALPDPWQPDEIPSEATLFMGTIPTMATRPLRSLGAATRFIAGLRRSRRASEADTEPRGSQRRPRASFNAAVEGQPHRALAWATVSMDDVGRVRSASGATLNDLALALCAGAVRRYLQARDEPCDEPLAVGNPVNVRTIDETGAYQNRVNIMGLQLPIHVADPAARLRSVCAETRNSKTRVRASSTNLLEDIFDIFSPGFVDRLTDTYSRAELARYFPPPIPYNLGVTNVQGPEKPTYFCGALLEGFYIEMMMLETMGPIFALISNAGSLHFSVTVVREVIAEPQEIADAIPLEMQLLVDALGIPQDRLPPAPGGASTPGGVGA